MNVTSKTQSQESLWSAAEDAAETVGVRVYNLRESGKGIAFTLKTGERAEPRIDWRGKAKMSPKYQRLSTRTDRSTARGFEGVEYQKVVPGCVCWHGHAAFLRAFYTLVSDAKVRTAFITYQNAKHFEATYRDTYHGKPNKSVRPFAYVSNIKPYADACTCEDGK